MANWNEIYKKEGREYGYYDILDPHHDLPRIVKEFKKQGVKKVLDLGCGAGRNLLYLARTFETYGLDPAQEGLRIAKEELRKRKLTAKLAKGDVFIKLPYMDNQFDAIVSVQVLQHGTATQIRKGIKEMRRVLKPGGLVFITLSGRLSRGKVRYVLVKTAKKIAPNTFVPKLGNEAGLTHFIYNKKLILEHYKAFRILSLWKDERDYYCFIGKSRA